jgi:hypothetical protein
MVELKFHPFSTTLLFKVQDSRISLQMLFVREPARVVYRAANRAVKTAPIVVGG